MEPKLVQQTSLEGQFFHILCLLREKKHFFFKVYKCFSQCTVNRGGLGHPG